MTSTRVIQNVAGVNSTTGFFFDSFPQYLHVVQVGWFAQGDGVVDGRVIAINSGYETITIEGPQVFHSGASYSFTSVRVTSDPPCFNMGTSILCLSKDHVEEYKRVEDIRPGDIVKTYIERYRRVHHVGKGMLVNNPHRPESCMFIYPKCGNMPEDLIVTGQHSILVDECDVHGPSLPRYNKFLIYACQSPKFRKLENSNQYTYYHFSLENDGDSKRVFVVWANGVLAETTCEYEFQKGSFAYEIQ